MINRKLRYLVKWDGFRIEHNSWEPWDNIHALDLVSEFYRKHPGAPRLIWLIDFNTIAFQSIPLSAVPGRHSLEGGMDVRGHLQAPMSQTEYVRLTTPDKLRLADTPYIPPHCRRPHLSPLIASPFWPPLTNWAQPQTSTWRYTPRYSASIDILLFVSFVWLPLYCIHPLFHFLLLLFVYNLQLILAEGLILLF